MGEGDPTFGAIVIAGMTMLVGTKLLVSAMVELFSQASTSAQLMAGSVPVTIVVGMLLLVATGALVTRLGWSRPLGIVSLAVVAVLGAPTLADPDPVAIAQTVLALLTVLYLIVANPVERPGRSDIDESESASRIGSTIR
jgi:predicted ABC-type sugar transport system permease subunit